MATPRRPHTSTALVACIAIFGCAKIEKPEKAPIKHDAAPAVAPVAVSVDAAPVAAPTDADSSAGKITISITKPTTPGTGFAKRCAIAGPPLATDCVGGSHGVAFDKAGKLYVASGDKVLRFTVASGECKLDPAGDPIEMPPNNPRPQVVGKGPMYMRSGGIAWELVQTTDGVFAHDFLVGLYRVDRDKAEPACTELFGFRSYAKAGKRWLGVRQGIEEVKLGKAGKCTAKPTGDKARAMFVVREKVYTKLDDLGVKICHPDAMTTCGDGACILDHNCPKLVQLGPDDSVLRTIEGEKLFDTRPWSLTGMATAADGSVYLYARHRDSADGKDFCEAAVYAIPPAVFAR